MITAERLKEVLSYDPDTGVFTWIKCLAARAGIGSAAGYVQKNGKHAGRVSIRIDGHLYLAHRLAVLYMTGAWPLAVVDHENCDQSDNRWANLRPATQSQNLMNTRVRTDNRSGLKGVSWDSGRKKWVAGITINGVRKSLGRFPDPLSAKTAYDNAAKNAYGEYARVK